MAKFLVKTFKFLLPIVIVGLIMEILLRQIPNDYHKKRDFLDAHSNEIEILSLGSSHGFYDINPLFFQDYGFNGAHVSQTLDYDCRIVERYQNNIQKLHTIIVPISYSSYYTQLKGSIESWRVKNYTIYYGFRPSLNFKDYFEIFNNRFVTNFSRLYNYYFLKKSEITCADNGFGIYKGEELIDIEKSSIEAANRHTTSDYRFFDENILLVERIINTALVNNVKVILFTPPAWKTYRENLNSSQLTKAIDASVKLSRDYTNVEYVNFISDSTFDKTDYFDGDHLNSKGAEKLTLKLNLLIENQR